jgi:hypothetical protein
MPTFAKRVRCFFPTDTISIVLDFLREHDFSQVTARGVDGKLCVVTVEGITRWLADNLQGNLLPAATATLDEVIALEPPDAFLIMDRKQTIFDAAEAFRNSIHSKSTRLYAIVITGNGSDDAEPIGFVTPWDLVHNPRLGQ